MVEHSSANPKVPGSIPGRSHLESAWKSISNNILDLIISHKIIDSYMVLTIDKGIRFPLH